MKITTKRNKEIDEGGENGEPKGEEESKRMDEEAGLVFFCLALQISCI